MLSRKLSWTFAVLVLAGLVAGCASTTGKVIYQQGRTIVHLEADPTVAQLSPQGLNSHPTKISPEQLASVLRGIGVRSEQGVLGTLLSLAVPAELVFQEDEISLLAPIFSKALAEATPSERIAFSYWSHKPVRRNAPLAGTIAMKDPYLKFTLQEHPIIGWQDPEDPSALKLFELEFVRPAVLRTGSEDERKRTRKGGPTLQIDYRRFLQDQTGHENIALLPKAAEPALSTSVEPKREIPPLVTPPATVPPILNREASRDALQRQIKELTDSNQELRARIRELSEQLTETKQLLADKVLELNRLKSKSGRSKGKSQAPNER
jgi:hypothetical protein